MNFTYDTLGRLTKDEDPAGGYKTVTKSDVSNEERHTTIETALGRQTSYEMDVTPDFLTLKTITDPAGLVTTTTYPPTGVIITNKPDGTQTRTSMGPEPQFSFLGIQPIFTKTFLPSGLVSSVNHTQGVVFSDPNNPLSLVSKADTTIINGRAYVNAYDNSTKEWVHISPEGRESATRLDVLGRVAEEIIPGNEIVIYSYDDRGRLSSITQGQGSEARSTGFSYNNSDYLSEIQDPEGRTFGFEYDEAGRVTKKIMPDNREANYTYDASGNISAITPPGRSAHESEYTEVDLEARYNPPSLGAGVYDTRYSYNLDKQLLKTKRPGGSEASYQYDSAGRVQSIAIPEGDFAFNYDPVTGKLGSILSPYNVTTSFTHDGFLPKSVTWSGAVSGSMSVDYDSNFWVTSQSVNGSSSISFDYDNDGVLIQAGDLVLKRDNSNGRLTGSSIGEVTDTLIYNAFGELNQYEACVEGNVIYKFLFDRDKLGRIIKKTETIGGSTQIFEYGYDLTGRLHQVKENGVVATSYNYDANGNRLSKMDNMGTKVGVYDAQDRVIQYGSATNSYSANGDLVSKTEGGQITFYEYDDFGNLIEVNLPDGTKMEYVIDGQNRRIGKKVNGILVQGFLYQSQLKPVAELDGSGNIMARFIYGSSANVPDLMVKGGVSYRIISDHLGSPRLVVNTSTGEVAQNMVFDEFGNLQSDSNPGFQPFGFAGGLYDQQTKLVRFGARDYSAIESRWTTKDPTRFNSNTLNFYTYVGNDPVNFTDPSGLVGEGKIRAELDKQFTDEELSPAEKDQIAKYSSDQLGWSDAIKLTKALLGDETAKKALAEKIADAVLKSGDQKLIDLYKKAKDLEEKHKKEKEKSKNDSCPIK